MAQRKASCEKSDVSSIAKPPVAILLSPSSLLRQSIQNKNPTSSVKNSNLKKGSFPKKEKKGGEKDKCKETEEEKMHE
eukprot:367134-Ditylum_brightwellii.AAC.1